MSPELLLIVDVETTGTEPAHDQLIEIGAILYSVSQRCTLQQLSTLVPVTGDNAALAINRIAPDAARLVASHDLEVLVDLLKTWGDRADFWVAHNARFDRAWLEQAEIAQPHHAWLCTYDDFRWPLNPKPTNLVATALNHGIGVSHAHRALTDCQLIAALFDRVPDFDAVLTGAIALSCEPWVYAIAIVSKADKDLAKSRGFRWMEYVPKRWVKRIKPSQLAQERDEYPFKIEVQPASD